jgi:signal transduction histidine kinase
LVNAAAAFVIVGVFWLPSIIDVAGTWRSAAGLTLAAVTAAAVMLRRRLPVSAATAAGAATVVASVLEVCQDPMLATAWCLYAPALTRASRVRWFVLVVVGAIAVLAAVTGVPQEGLGDSGRRLVVAAAALSVSWLLGVTVGRQVESVRESERARAAEHAARVQLDVARDVHDVVGHALALISAEAGVTRGLANAGEQELRDALADIEGHARTALEDIQSLVRSLREGPGMEPDPFPRVEPAPGRSVEPRRADTAAPVPGISQLPALLATMRAAGVRVDARIAAPDQIDEVDEVVAAVAFRIVQEASSNVVRHAAGAACTVELRPDGDVLVVRVRDDGPGAKEESVSGFGLRGMRERARLVGGTAAWRNLPGGGFEVEARLPLGDSG